MCLDVVHKPKLFYFQHTEKQNSHHIVEETERKKRFISGNTNFVEFQHTFRCTSTHYTLICPLRSVQIAID